MIVLYICMQIMFQIEHVRCYVFFFRLNVGSFFVLAISSCIFGEKKNLPFRLAMAVQHSTVPIALINFIVSLRNSIRTL